MPLLVIVIAVGLAAVVQIFTDPRITAKFAAKSLIALAVYLGHATAGIAFLCYLSNTHHDRDVAFGAVIAFAGWIGLGMLGLIRFAPRLREPPRALMHFGIADIICLLAIALGIARATGLI